MTKSKTFTVAEVKALPPGKHCDGEGLWLFKAPNGRARWYFRFTLLHRRTSYAASKHALEGFFNSLRSEEKPYGVHCLIAAPSFVATNIGNPQAQANGIVRPGSAMDGIDYMSPEQAVAAILRGYDRRDHFTPVGRVARLSWWLNRLSPSWFERLMEKRIMHR